jgi:cellulose synthase/poly-beta-1,6-N-acetylglucosamine synthase-like glycosyltransferase
MIAVFWSSILCIAYSYLGYPIALYLISLVRNKKVKRDETFCPPVTLIVTVYNEERRLGRKMGNTLELDYPPDKFEIIFASDASTDATDELIKACASMGVRLVRSPYRGGKELTQRCAIGQAKGDVLVFTDVATMLGRDAIRTIVANFADESVGCVSSEYKVLDEHGKTSSEGVYVRYEMWLRTLETRVNSVVGLSGSFFAARKEVCLDWPTDIPSDFNTLLNSIRVGYRGISDPRSVGIYTTVNDERRELERKVRTITRGISALLANKSLLNPFRYGLFSWQLASHKLMRWFVPCFMIVAFVTNILLSLWSFVYRFILLVHVVFYFLSIIGSRIRVGSSLTKVPYFFVHANCAILIAWLKYLQGDRFVTWEPSKRL